MSSSFYPWWVTFGTRRAAVCIEAETEEQARETAKRLLNTTPETIHRLPYPANPRVEGNKTDMIPFCYRPQQCAGHTACPTAPSCTS